MSGVSGDEETLKESSVAVDSQTRATSAAKYRDSHRGVEEGPWNGWSDEELFRAVVIRRERAFAELYGRHWDSVAACSRLILRNKAESDDIAAEVFIRFWIDPAKFDADRGSLLSYLRLQAKGRSIDLIRAESARSRRERNDARKEHVVDSGVDSDVLASEASYQLRQALSSLPPREREAIELAYFNGMSQVAVAHHLGLPEGTVKARIRKGMARLRSIYDTNFNSDRSDRDAGVDTIVEKRNFSDTVGQT